MSRADVAARALLDQSDPGAPIDLDKLAVDLGALVVRQEIDPEVSGMLLRREGQIVIGLNSQRTSVDQRFILAHLIGHLQMHRRRDLILDMPTRYRHGQLAALPTDREEAEANRFAGALLAPEPEVRRAAADAGCSTGAELVDVLADRFGLSCAVMGYRLMTLGVVMDI